MKPHKKIIFFDGDGTLWYPKTTKRTKKPHWIYYDPILGKSEKKYIGMLTLTPFAKQTLRELKKRDIQSVIISTHPHPKKIAKDILEKKIRYFGLEKLVDEFHPVPDMPTGKGKIIERILERKKIPKSLALLIGDSYRYDYQSAKLVGIEALLMHADYTTEIIRKYKMQRHIATLKDILKWI